MLWVSVELGIVARLGEVGIETDLEVGTEEGISYGCWTTTIEEVRAGSDEVE